MFKPVKFLVLVLCLLVVLAVVSAENSTESTELVDESRKRRRRPFGEFGWGGIGHHHGYRLWWWGLKALSIFFTVKIKIVLLLLFLGGGIFYGLKIWQGTALGCPEPIIQEIVKNHHFGGHDIGGFGGPPEIGGFGGGFGGDFGGISPYHSYSSGDISAYPGGSTGFDSSSVYSNTPGPSPAYSGPTYLPPGPGSAPGTGPGSDPSASAPQGFSYNRRKGSSGGRSLDDDAGTGRQISEESVNTFSDLIFRFLSVNSDQCRRRFVCELEFRNPYLGYAFKYVGVELFKQYVTPKNNESAPRQFTDCAKLYSECRAPNEHPVGVVSNKKRKNFKDRTQTVTPTVEETTPEIDIVTQYVQSRKI